MGMNAETLKPWLEHTQRQLIIPDLKIFLQSDWGASARPNPTSNGRRQLAKFIETQSLDKTRISVSHTKGVGGFATSSSPRQIGFDMEITERVSPEIARRICQLEEEFDEAPSPALLWVAKESAFKSTRGFTQPTFLSLIKISAWKTITTDIYSFKFSIDSSTENHGTAFSSQKLSFGLAFYSAAKR